MKKLAISTLVVGVVYLIGYWGWYGYLPPETPRKILSKHLAVPLPATWKIAYFHQKWSAFLGDGILKAVVEVPEGDLALAEKCVRRAKIFDSGASLKKESCFLGSMIAGDRDLIKFLNHKSKGVYDCKVNTHALNDKRVEDGTVFDYSRVVILDKGNKRLLVYMLRM